MTNVADDADDFVSFIAYRRNQAFAQYLFVRKNSVDELLTDYDYLVTFSDLLFGEISSAQQRNFQSAEVVLVNATKVSVKSLVRRNRWPALDGERNVVKLAAEWQLSYQTDNFDAG